MAHATDHDDPKTSATVLVGIVGVIMVLAIMLFTIALYYSEQNLQDRAKVYGRGDQEALSLRSEQQGKLGGYRLISEAEGTAVIPIERAMELTARDLKTAREQPTIPQSPVDAQTTQPAAPNPEP